MEMQIITIFCICDEIFKQQGFNDDPQCRMSSAEVITTVIVASCYFGGNHEQARHFLKEHGYIPSMLSKSQLNRRFHMLGEDALSTIFSVISKYFKTTNTNNEFAVDSFPVKVCENIRIKRCKIYHTEEYRGYMSGKKQYFYGLRVHMITSTTGEPIEFVLAPGSNNDVKILKQMNLDLPKNSTLYADKAYNDYTHEDLAKEAAGIHIIADRKKNSRRPMEACLKYIHGILRKPIETAFSCITRLFPKSIHAVTAKGFELKVGAFILAYAMQAIS